MTETRVSVVIPTRNRWQNLVHNLGSILSQTRQPDEVIVVDNASKDETREVVKAVKKNSNLQLKYIQEKKVGYPYIYNRGLREATYKWVAFLDDDCVAATDWFNNIYQCIKTHQDAVAILGYSQPLNLDNSLVIADYFYKQLGLLKIKENLVQDYEILDSKNIIYNQSFLSRQGLSFDESLVKKGNGSSEDCDLGMQIQQAEGKAVYCPQIKVLHKEEVKVVTFYQKLIARTKDHLLVEDKWLDYRQDKNLGRVSWLRAVKFLLNYLQKYSIPVVKLPVVMIHLVLIWLIKKIVRIKFNGATRY
jgi:GT2 family glycosyltransferase